MTNIINWARNHKANLVYSPYVELFFDTLRSSNYCPDYSNMDPGTVYNTTTIAEASNRLVEELRQATRTREFKKKINDLRENSYRNFKSSIEYVDRLFTRHSRLLYIRIDLSIDYLSIPDDSTALQLLLGYFKNLRKWISRKIEPFKHLDGYIAHVEYGTEKGHHIHMSLFYYEQERRADYIISEQVGNAWIKVTKGIGRWQSTNRDRQRPKCNALGRIHRDDTDKRHCLCYTLWYTVKTDQYLRYKHSQNQRLFFRGKPHHKKVNVSTPHKNNNHKK